MKQLNKLQTVLFLAGGFIMTAGAGCYAFLFMQKAAAVVYLVGAILFASMQIIQSYDGNSITYYDFLTNKAGITGLPARSSDGKWNFDQVQTVISVLEDKMDSLNTISQDTLIQLQSLTAKRDQTYDLVSNALKSFNTVLVGNANNI